MRAKFPRIVDLIVTKAECKWCEKIRGPCDYAESIQAILTDMKRMEVSV